MLYLLSDRDDILTFTGGPCSLLKLVVDSATPDGCKAELAWLHVQVVCTHPKIPKLAGLDVHATKYATTTPNH